MVFNISISHFYIIQSLRPDDKQTGRLLHEEVFRYRLFQRNKLSAKLIDVSDLTEFRNALDGIAEAGRSEDVRPFIHFEIHGSPAGMELGNGEFVTWKELYPFLVAINTCTKNNLFLTLATCYGAAIGEACDIRKRAPFAWYIGPKHAITSENAYNDYTVFFDHLLTSLDFHSALDTMNEQNPNQPYYFFSAEEFFRKALNQWIEQHEKPEKQLEKKEEILRIARQRGYTTSDEEIFKIVEKEISKIPEFGNKAIDYFLFKSDVRVIL